jgi:hypothetical protein
VCVKRGGGVCVCVKRGGGVCVCVCVKRGGGVCVCSIHSHNRIDQIYAVLLLLLFWNKHE